LVEAGEARDIIIKLWQADSGDPWEWLSKVGKGVELLAYVLIMTGNYPIDFAHK